MTNPTNPESGGPAFPVECEWYGGNVKGVQTGPSTGWSTGMTLRDYFAAKAMQAIITKVEFFTAEDGNHPAIVAITGGAYDYADAMLKAREVAP